jgi:hypothetical protein
MRSFRTVLCAVTILGLGASAYAELQNVTVGGSIRIRGNWYHLHDNGGEPFTLIEQRTRLGVQADFTEDVSAYIELDSYDIWGDDFRSNPVTGLDFANPNGDVDVYQAYIEARNMWGTDLHLRVGRQELAFGSQWLVGVNDAAAAFQGLSFDALRLTYGNEDYSIDAFAAKLAESGFDLGEKDTNLYGIYASLNGGVIADVLEDTVFDAYYLWLNDDGPAAGNFVGGRLMDIHTVGLRMGGSANAFDYEAEVAYQWGYVGREGLRDLDYGNFAANAELGYTFDVNTNPRIYAGFAYFGGSDAEDGLTEGDLSFNRLFSNWEYSEFIENTELSNMYIFRLGGSLNPTEELSLSLASAFFLIEDSADLRRGLFGRKSSGADSQEGIEVGLYADYQYSEDLVFRAGYAHLFTLEGAEDPRNIFLNGLASNANPTSDDADYWFVETELSF